MGKITSAGLGINDFMTWERASILRCLTEVQLLFCSYFVVVVHAVEQLHSVQAGRVQIPGWNQAFLFRVAVDLFILGIGLFLSMCYKTVHSFCYSFLCPIIIYHKFTNCNLTTYQEKGIIQSKERPGKAHIEKNVHTLYFLL